ncbi:hypothetical protein B4135_0627 [Caldibacillus debilis]|mgnify:FL=1|uniref:Molecular chaperone DnaJ n=1 Tax=Caldibacillus debilis TaxID=301148 RepID=A0A150MFB4_9BACI|nr:hypothetical protein B4135_0627 [Caldibacillus debilis]
MDCPFCNGSGETPCLCRGGKSDMGACEDCKGDGYIVCPRCNGTGLLE